MNGSTRNWIILALLVVVFTAPSMLAVYFYHHPALLGDALTNKGTFVKPPVVISTLANALSSEKNASPYALVLWFPSNCDTTCMSSLDELYRVRLALGRRFYEVQGVLLTGGEPLSLSRQEHDRLTQQGTLVVPSAEDTNVMKARSLKPMIYIANSNGYLILQYVTTSPMDDIYYDLKQLLSNGVKGN